MASAPACLAGLAPRKGAISAGADADLVFFDPDAESVVDPRALHHRHPVTPYAGMALRGAVRTTLLRGVVIFKDGEVMQAATGQMIGSQR
jgi:allantoinase